MTESLKTRAYKKARRDRIRDNLLGKEQDRAMIEEAVVARLSEEERNRIHDDWQSWRRRILKDAVYRQYLSFFDERTVQEVLFIVEGRYENDCAEPSDVEAGLRMLLDLLESRIACVNAKGGSKTFKDKLTRSRNYRALREYLSTLDTKLLSIQIRR